MECLRGMYSKPIHAIKTQKGCRCKPTQREMSNLGTSLSEHRAEKISCLPLIDSGQQWPPWPFLLAVLLTPARENQLVLWSQNTELQGSWVISGSLRNSHLYFYPELPCRGLESMGIKHKVVPSSACDWNAIAKRPLRQRWSFVGSNIERHMAWSYKRNISISQQWQAIQLTPKHTIMVHLCYDFR